VHLPREEKRAGFCSAKWLGMVEGRMPALPGNDQTAKDANGLALRRSDHPPTPACPRMAAGFRTSEHGDGIFPCVFVSRVNLVDSNLDTLATIDVGEPVSTTSVRALASHRFRESCEFAEQVGDRIGENRRRLQLSTQPSRFVRDHGFRESA